MLSAGRWTASSTAIRLLLQYTQMMVLARLLTPGDFGHMALIAALVAIAGIIADFGLSNALIHFETPSLDVLSSIYWTNIIISLLLFIVFVIIANPMAAFYNTPELSVPLALISVIFPINAIGNQFKVLAEKELRFITLTWIEILSAIVAFLLTLILAANDYGIYSLVAGVIASSSSRSILFCMFLSSKYKIKFTLNIFHLGKYFRYGAYKLGETFINTFNNQSDIFLGGYFSGASNIGIYSTPKDQNMNIANNFVNPIVSRISMPAMAKVQLDQKSLKNIYLLALRMTSSINFPIYVFIGFYAPEIIAVLLGSQWVEASFYMAIFAIWGGIRSIANPTGSLLYSTGNVRRAFWWNFFLLVTTFTILYIAISQWGLKGLSMGMLAIQILFFVPVWRYLVYPILGAKFNEYLSQLIPPFIIALISGVTVRQLSNHIDLNNHFLELGLSGLIFTTIYIFISIKFNTLWFSTMRKVLNL